MCLRAKSSKRVATVLFPYAPLKLATRKSLRMMVFIFTVRFPIIPILSTSVIYGLSSAIPTAAKCSFRSEDRRKKYSIVSSSALNLPPVMSASRICFLVSSTVRSSAISLLRSSCFSNFSTGESGAGAGVPSAVPVSVTFST